MAARRAVKFPLTMNASMQASPRVVRYVPPALAASQLGKESLKTFGKIYFDLVDAVVDNDIKYLE
jgi:hypothetical protein